jgi:hypothetical protein
MFTPYMNCLTLNKIEKLEYNDSDDIILACTE